MDIPDTDGVMRTCTRFLTHHFHKKNRQVLSELAADHYGEGELIRRFEMKVAELLDKEAAVFMPSGTMCQQIALHIWAERRKTGYSSSAFSRKTASTAS